MKLITIVLFVATAALTQTAESRMPVTADPDSSMG
jgi:hypothetical protein